MGKDTGKRAKKKDSDAPEDRFRCVLVFRTREEVRKFVRQHPLDVVETRQEDEAIRLVLFLTQTEIKQLQKGKYSPEVGENVSEIGRERQKEVAEGDRFEGGRVAPRGLGVPRKERD